ncbi:hypothetical protein [Lentzea cavernae]|uniref:DUF2970 domain-containing protein n=1 Tax=Lentzea cavernae TaxID=2020703 RepID=A0ABQ3MXR2_9PSEU|nr:hypothetical protein [Lentzea cavernae]GHH62471.1 hypothetical protein GCM10017774_90300 [Lentzea cavernae]
MSIEMQILVVYLQAGLERIRRDDRGYSTEFVVGTALLVSATIAAVAFIVAKIIQKAQSIPIE